MWSAVQSDSEGPDSEESSPELFLSAHLRMLAGACARPTYSIGVQGLSIGREGCDIVIADDPRISRKHARVERSFAGWQFQDLGSRNGFYVNGRGFGRGQRTLLPDASVIQIGDSVMVFRTTPLPADLRIDSPVFPGVSPEAANVRGRIDELAASFGHVLILGETGTGKESVAKAIGAQCTPHPFVTLNCAQLNREMARSELFGHVRGAFTNAVSTRPGLVDLAGEGALFLDEIGDLPLDAQAELLRFLEDGSYHAVGSTDMRKSSARVVAATNIDLDRAVYQARFRRDLLARLCACNTPLTLPPLRDRREDILGWTQLFFRLRGREPGPRPWTGGALECLLLYPWQKNLRELLAAVNFAASQTHEFPCTHAHLPAQVCAHRSGLRMPLEPRPDDPTPAPRPPPAPPPPNEDLPPRPDPTRDEIIDVLKQTRGWMRTTAQLLKIDRRPLYRLCKAYDINPDDYRDHHDADKRRADRDHSLAAALKGCESVLRHRDMYYSGELCAELQCAFEEISRSTRTPSAAVLDDVPFPQDGIAGFSRVIVLDAKRAVSPGGIFDFDVFIEVIARAITEALGLDLDTRNLHREQLSQFLKDERDILFCFFSLDHLTERHYRQLRGLGFTQTDHRILFCGRSEFLQRQSTTFAESLG